MAEICAITNGSTEVRLPDEGVERIRAAYGSKRYDRLVALKNKYDPKNLFRSNQNIKPSISRN